MHAFLAILSVATLFYSAESPQVPIPFDAQQVQNWLLHRALSRNLQTIVQGNDGDFEDVCTWQGIECTDGLTTSLCAQYLDFAYDVNIKMCWLPPTLEFIHLNLVDCFQESPLIHLPRELKYLYWKDLTVLPYNAYAKASIVCARLPAKMEELILNGSTTVGKICLYDMPQTMRYVYIEQSLITDAIFVNYTDLPASIEEMWVTSSYNCHKLKRKVRAIGNPGSVKLHTKHDTRYPKKGSKYFEEFEVSLP